MDTSDLQPDRSSKLSKWQAYVDDALLMTGQVTEAAIYGVDGVKWAASKNLTVSGVKASCSSMQALFHCVHCDQGLS